MYYMSRIIYSEYVFPGRVMKGMDSEHRVGSSGFTIPGMGGCVRMG